MTKIRNTKKGMAKKTLSISLAVAMLATSNVPVWAAEDLFTDGEVAVEAFTEAPVVEETVEVPEAQAVDSNYNVDYVDFDEEFQWGVETPVKVKITDAVSNENVTSTMKFRFVDANGHEVDVYGNNHTFGVVDADGYATVGLNFAKEHVGKSFRMQVYKDLAEDWINVSPTITVQRKAITGTATCAPARYTGSQITETPELSNIVYSEEVDANEISFGDIVVKGDDTINSINYSGAKLTASVAIVSDYYTGTIAVDDFQIWRKVTNDINDAVKVELPAYVYEYTGDKFTILSKDITVTDKVTGKAVAEAAGNFQFDKEVGKKTSKVLVDMKKGTLANFSNEADADFPAKVGVAPVETVEVVKRDLSNDVNTKISIRTVTQDLLQNSTINAENLKDNLVITDAEGNVLKLKNDVTLEFDGKSTLEVEAGKTYSVTVKAKTDNVVNSRTVNFTVVAHDLSTATFENEGKKDFLIQDVTYNGEKFTFDLTAANLTEKLGELKVGDTPLSKETDYDVNVVFGENTNAGTGTITINGKGGYLGSKKVLTFEINPRTVTNDAVVVPEKVLYNETIREADEYAVEAAVVVKFTENKKDYALTVPTSDYTVAYAFDKENKVGDVVVTTISKNTNKNFVFASDLVGRTTIANKAIAEADVQLAKTEYTYTAKAIVPEYTVVVDGVTLVKDKDYTEQVIHNTDVGEATLKITGMGEYDTTSVNKKFTIVAANVSDVKVESKKDTVIYDGKQHLTTEELSITLNGVDVSNQLKALFPTSKLANINAGDAVVTLVANEKLSKNFVGEKEFTFVISPRPLGITGSLTAFDAKGTKVDIAGTVFDYDETAHTFVSTVYKNTVDSPMKFTENDYEIIYKDNIIGNDGKGAILVVAKGNYAGLEANDYTCADKTVVKNVIYKETFTIKPIDIANATVTVENGAYAEGDNVDPVVKVVYNSKELVKDKDFFLDYPAGTDRTKVTNGKTLLVHIVGKGGYNGYVNKWFTWGIDKFDFANAEVVVSGTDAEPIVKVINNGKVVDADNYDLVVADGKVTVTAKADSKNYTGTQTVEIKHALEKPATPMITDVKVVGNKATVVLSGEAEGAVGYDYVIGARDCIETKDYVKVNKNKLTTETTFTYTQQGTYYAYCHAWTRDENGKKVFSDWSNGYPFAVTAITPDTPVITGVKANGSTVTVTYTKAANADGYDVVLGSTYGTVADEKRPLQYGELVKKNIKGNTVTATFKNVPAGTYYAGLHAFNRTSEDGKKVFSPWSNIRTIKVK